MLCVLREAEGRVVDNNVMAATSCLSSLLTKGETASKLYVQSNF